MAAWLTWPRPAMAGMPSVTFSDLAGARFQVVSFFLLVLLLCAWAVQKIWNGLAADVPRLPRLTFGKSLGVISLWGLLFVLVLTMVSGARELMTPGAWVKQGWTYRLAQAHETAAPPPGSEPGRDLVRRDALERLRAALWRDSQAHGGRFPRDGEASRIEPEAWQLPDAPGMRYLYVGGRTVGEPERIVAFEPGLYGRDRYVLLADGTVRLMTLDEIRKALGPSRPAAAVAETP